MSHIALYREWRPQTFSEIVAQEQVTFPLKQSIINGEINHAYLFTGTRGTGKTSTAKVLAKAVNCLHPVQGDPCNQCEICQAINDGSLLDVLEIDAASNNSVDNIRRIVDEIVFMPTRAKYKVYIIDEVHMLSQGAFNALLKTLEEPPAHAIFILATTEPHRIPATVISRCIRFDFRRIPQHEIVENLKRITAADKIEIKDDALQVIAQLAEGAMRDAISILDQAKSGITYPVTKEKLLNMMGIVQDQFMLLLFEALLRSDLRQVLHLIDEMVMSGKDLERFISEFTQFLRNVLITKITSATDEWLGFSQSDLKTLLNLINHVSETLILDWIEEISKLSSELKYAGDVRITIEVCLIKLLAKNKEYSAKQDAIVLSPVETPISTKQKVTVPTPEIKEKLNPDSNTLIGRSGHEQKPIGMSEGKVRTESDPGSNTVQKAETVPEMHSQANQIAESETNQKTEAEADQEPAVEAKVNHEFGTEVVAKVNQENEFEPYQKTENQTVARTDQQNGSEVTANPEENRPEQASDAAAEVIAEIRSAIDSYLVGQHRIDLKMLLAPAGFTYHNGTFEISYTPNLKSHYKEIAKPENQDLIRKAIQYMISRSETQSKKQGEADMRPAWAEGEGISRDFELKTNLLKENTDKALNPDEPEWVIKVRKMAQDLDIPIQTEE